MKPLRTLIMLSMALGLGLSSLATASVDTGQQRRYNRSGKSACPAPGQAYCGQDAQYQAAAPVYRDNGDGRELGGHLT